MTAKYANVVLDFNMENISNELHALIGDSSLCSVKDNNEYPPPQFEFHYLRSSLESAPLLSSTINTKMAIQNSQENECKKFRKIFPKQKQDFFHRNKTTSDSNISIGLGNDGKERNQVLRLFGLFHEMHYNMNEVLPCTYAMFTTHNICLIPPVRSSMPTTMNIQYQVKRAARKCIEFICELERIINENKLFNREMYDECENSLRNLRKILCQFEIYKRIELEHKHGQFTSNSASVHAENLNSIMRNLNECIRYSNFLVYFFDWTMSKKYNKTRIERRLHMPVSQQSLIQKECINMGRCENSNLLFLIMRELRNEEQEQQLQGAYGFSKPLVNTGICHQLLSSPYDSQDIDRDPIRFVG